MADVILMIFTGLAVGGVYFLLASGLGLIFGLLRILSFAHGAILAACAYGGWLVLRDAGGGQGPSELRVAGAIGCAIVVGAVLSFLIELILIRPFYRRDPLDQLLVTAGIGFALVALLAGIWGPDDQVVPSPAWISHQTVTIGGARVQDVDFLLIGAAVVVLAALELFLRYTRHGLIVRAGVENREMVSALGIDVAWSFTMIFTLGGAVAGLGGAVAELYASAVSPAIGNTYLLYAFIVLVIGGIGSLRGAAIASVIVGLVQQFVGFYVSSSLGDIIGFVLMAICLYVRPQGIAGQKVRLI
jgi:branched-chain amino acid transport system permease protein